MVGNDLTTLEQIRIFAESVAYGSSKIRIMPDAHAGKGAVVGSTMTYTDKIVPATVGVDIACRVSGFCLGSVHDIDLNRLDEVCRKVVPTGFSVRNSECEISEAFPYENLYCWDELINHDRLRNSMGTLGGGNHYLELDYDEEHDEYWFVIHCGSRNLGKQVAEYYQTLAVEARDRRILQYKADKNYWLDFARWQYEHDYITREQIIEFIDTINKVYNECLAEEPDDDLCYLEGEDMEHYLHDMRICNDFSYYSHLTIYREVAYEMGWPRYRQRITCIHNYVDVDHGIIRKGAIEGYKGQVGLIPLNMRDGVLIVRALGNEDWNCSLPHGAGRLMSRGEARKALSMDDFAAAMNGIISSSVVVETIDEAPMAYKDSAAIIEAIAPNAEIVAHMLPVFNFKAL